MKKINTIVLNAFLFIKKAIPYLIAGLIFYGALWFIAFLGNIEKGL